MRLFVPRPYQSIAIDHIVKNRRCALWAEMGLGKTASALAAFNRLNYTEDVFPTLIVAPLRVARDTWKDEIAKWHMTADLKISPVLGDVSERQQALRKGAHYYSINYENVPWFVEMFGKKWPFKNIIADESVRLKSFRIRQGGERARELYKVSWGDYCNRFIELAGKPAPQGLEDLYGQAHFLDGGERLGRTFTSFSQRWFKPTWDGYGIEPLPHAQGEIQEKLSDICLSIRAKDWFDLKEPIVNNIYVTLPPAARKIYNQMEREMFVVIQEQGVEALNAASKRIKCHQICQGALYVGEGSKEWKVVHDEKIEALRSVIAEAAGAPVMVSYQFKSDLARLKEAFPKALDLSTEEGLKKFKTGKFAIGLAHPASMAHGIDGLQHPCNILCYFGHGDNLDNHEQIAARIGPVRQLQSGYDRPVYIHHIVAAATVEEYAILPNLQGKGNLQDLLMDAMRRYNAQP